MSPLRDPAVGDLLAVPVTGAYCYTMSNQYNGARRVPVVFARNGNARLVVRRDTWDDLLIRDVDSERGKIGGMTEPAASLVELARRYGVATEYEDWTGRHATVAESTLVAVLDALGVPAATEDERAAALAAHDRDYWARPLPPTIVGRAGARRRSGCTSPTAIPSVCGCGSRTVPSAPGCVNWRTTRPLTISTVGWSVRPASSCPPTCRWAITDCIFRSARPTSARSSSSPPHRWSCPPGWAEPGMGPGHPALQRALANDPGASAI